MIKEARAAITAVILEMTKYEKYNEVLTCFKPDSIMSTSGFETLKEDLASQLDLSNHLLRIYSLVSQGLEIDFVKVFGSRIVSENVASSLYLEYSKLVDGDRRLMEIGFLLELIDLSSFKKSKK